MSTTSPTNSSAFTNPEALQGFIDARWEVTPEVRDRLTAQLGGLTVHDVLERLVWQLVDDVDHYDMDGYGWYGGAWIMLGPMRDSNGCRRQLLEAVPADTATA